jgi:outer membrane protein assembly factor BamB
MDPWPSLPPFPLTLGASAQDWPSFRGPGAQGIVYRERTGTTHSASPVASDGKVYLAGEDGQLLVLRAGRAFEVLARIDMGETVFATPAISRGTMYVRTRGHVYAISATGQAAASR